MSKEFDDYEFPPEPEHKPQEGHSEGWTPRLNPTQQKHYDSTAKYVLAYGEKGSGKSIGSLHALVRHCYDENNALALIIAPAIRSGKEGVMADLEWVMDVWRNGNMDKDGNRLDEGMGLEFTDPALDPQTKDRIIYIGNRHGGWSKVILISIPYAEVVAKRMKALSPSFVYEDEMTELTGIEYFTYVAQQLGRRRGISGPQQFYASTNPEGPSHWVYHVFWRNCIDEETGIRDKDYEVYHIPVHENIKNLPPGYVDGLRKLYRDETEKRRLLKGEWIDRPTGDAIFRQFFRPEFHIVGDALKGPELLPKRGFPIVTGWDPGPVNYCITFEQFIPTKDGKVVWLIFDELNFVGRYMPDFRVIPEAIRKIEYWSNFLGGNPNFIHIGDEAAFNQIRHDGSYDATRVRDLSNGRIRLRPCGKGRESVPARVQMTNSLLIDEAIYVNPRRCPGIVDMFTRLESEKPKEGKYDANIGLKPARSPYIHPFDSMTYPIFYFQLNPARFSIQAGNSPAFAFRAGSR